MDRAPANQQMAVLREGHTRDTAGAHLVNLCLALDCGLPLSSEALADVIRKGAQIDLGVSSATALPHDAVGLALYSGRGKLTASNPLFHRCVADPERSQPLAELRVRASAQGRS